MLFLSLFDLASLIQSTNGWLKKLFHNHSHMRLFNYFEIKDLLLHLFALPQRSNKRLTNYAV